MTAKKFNLLIFNLVILFFIFLRLSYVDNSVSFDRIFYIEFIDEISKLNFNEFYEKIVRGFPYFAWADFGAFESGFAIVSYLFSLAINPSLVWAVLGVISVGIKLQILSASDVGVFKIYTALIFSLILFEVNALRAGIAVAMLMIGLFYLYKKRFISVLLLIFSCLFHLSSIALLLVIFFGALINKSKHVGAYIVFAVIGSAILALSLPMIGQFFGGKLYEYYIQSTEFGLYTGASGLNFSSLICIVFFVKFTLFFKAISEKDKNAIVQRKIATIGCLISGVCASILLFSGPFAIVGDRVWQMALMPLLILEARIGSIKGIYFPMINYASSVLIGIYVFVNLLLRYPQSNFFGLLLPVVELIPPTVY